MSQLRTGRDGSDVPSETSRSSTPSRAQQRRPLTTEETEAVGKYFAGAIEERVSVSLADCKRFLQFQKLDRTPKNIQYKVRSLTKAKPVEPWSTPRQHPLSIYQASHFIF